MLEVDDRVRRGILQMAEGGDKVDADVGRLGAACCRGAEG
jgi:hypothetical protein